MIVFGHRHYGHTDEIEGMGHIQTRFLHVWYIPLIPFSSVFVVGEDDDGLRGVKVPLSAKSVAFVWSRTAIFLGGVGALVGGITASVGSIDAIQRVVRQLQRGGVSTKTGMELLTVGGAAAGGICMAFFCVALYILVGRVFRKAGASRRRDLMQRLGVSATAHHEDDGHDDDEDDDPFDAELI
jgi:hypothetical protein